MAAHPAPEQRPVLARHDALVRIAVALLQRLDANVADAHELLERRIEDGEGTILKLLDMIAEHLGKPRITGADHPALGHHEADGRVFEGEQVKIVFGGHGWCFYDVRAGIYTILRGAVSCFDNVFQTGERHWAVPSFVEETS
jgi:hypothetical protein